MLAWVWGLGSGDGVGDKKTGEHFRQKDSQDQDIGEQESTAVLEESGGFMNRVSIAFFGMFRFETTKILEENISK